LGFERQPTLNTFAAALASLAIFIVFAIPAFADSSADNTPSTGGWNTSWCLPPFGGCDSVTLGGTEDLSSLNLPGSWSSPSFTNAAGTRKYYLYTPQNGSNAPLPLVVALHGCTEDAPIFAMETGLAEIAEKYGFAVIFPEEPQSANVYECWNWFDPANTVRGQYEISIIAGMVQDVSNSVQIDATRVYAAGFSSGAAMVSSLLSCYSDVFSGGLINSGLQFKAVNDPNDAVTAMESGSTVNPIESGNAAAACTGSGAKLENVLIIHGDLDPIVAPLNSTLALKSFTQMNDILDDGVANGSQSTQRISTHSHTVPNGGDQYKVDSYGGNGVVHIVNVTVAGMGHAWSGAHQAGLYADPNGPDAGEMMWQFLSQASH
jgi:poly(hydroxyalkanoate) depolymerase family esterase